MGKHSRNDAPAEQPHSPRRWLDWVVMPALLLVVVLTVFAVITHEDEPPRRKWLGCGDPFTYAGPTQHFLDHRIHHGELPLWNPLTYSGQPFAANPQSFMFYPFNFIRSQLNFDPTPYKTHVGIAVLVLFHVWIGGVGAYALARRHGLTRAASLVAAIVCLISTPAITRAMGHWYFHLALAWVPWLFLSAHAFMTADVPRQRRQWIAACAILYGLILLAGTPHFMVLSGYLLFWYCVLWRCAGYFASPSFTAKQLARELLHDGARLASIAILGALLAAPLLLPAEQFSRFTGRGLSDLRVEHILRTGPPWNLFQLSVIFSGDETFEGNRLSGALTAVLALAALAAPARKTASFCAAFFLIAFDCSLDHPVFFGRIFQAISPYPVSAPPRGTLIALVPWGLLAGLGIDAVTTPVSSPARKRSIATLLIVGGCTVIGTVAYSAVPHPFIDIGPSIVVIPACGVAAALFLLWRPARSAAPILAVTLIMELWFWNAASQRYWIAESALFPKDPEILHERPAFWQGNSRGTDKWPNLRLYELTPAINGYDPMYIHDVAELMNAGQSPSHGYRRLIDFFEATSFSYHGMLYMKRQFWLAQKYALDPVPNTNALFPPTTVYLDKAPQGPVPFVPSEDRSLRAVSDNVRKHSLLDPSEGFVVLAPPDGVNPTQQILTGAIRSSRHAALRLTVQSGSRFALVPLFYDAHSSDKESGKVLTVFPTPNGQGIQFEIPLPDYADMRFVLRPEFRKPTDKLVVIELTLLSDMADENDCITIRDRTANRVELELTNLPAPRILLNVDAWYPGWRAFVDEKPVPILRANKAFKAVYVPAGTHTVVFEFRAPRVTFGLALSLITLVVIGSYLATPFIKRRLAAKRT